MADLVADPSLLLSLDEAVTRLSVDPSGRRLIVGSAAGEISLVDCADLHTCHLPAAAGVVTAADWHDSGDVVALGTSRGTVALLSPDLSTLELVRDLGFVTDLAWRPAQQGPPLLAVAAGSAVHLLEPSGAIVGCWPTFTGTVNSVTWAPGPTALAAGGPGGIAWLEVARPGEVATTFASDGSVTALALDARGARLAAGDATGQVRVTDLLGGDEVALDGYPDRHRFVLWCPTGDLLLVADDEASIWRFDGIDATGDEPVLLQGHDEAISGVCCRGGGVVTAGLDGQVQWWHQTEGTTPHAVRLLQADSPVTALVAMADVAGLPGPAVRSAVGTAGGDLWLC